MTENIEFVDVLVVSAGLMPKNGDRESRENNDSSAKHLVSLEFSRNKHSELKFR